MVLVGFLLIVALIVGVLFAFGASVVTVVPALAIIAALAWLLSVSLGTRSPAGPVAGVATPEPRCPGEPEADASSCS
jgi:hypothetical protein